MGRRARIRSATLAAIATASLTGALAATPGAGAAGTIGGSGRPACTRAALQAGLTRGADPMAHAHVIRPFGCAGRWAYAAVNTKRFTITSLFEVRDGRWVTADRTKACDGGAVPKRIHKPACETN